MWINGRRRDMCRVFKKKREKILSPISFEVGIKDPYKKKERGIYGRRRDIGKTITREREGERHLYRQSLLKSEFKTLIKIREV